MSGAKKLTIILTAREAHLAWGFVDGCLDAGACRGGNTDEEQEALRKLADALYDHSRAALIPKDGEKP